MLGFHWPELIIVLVIALVVFGPRKLPEIGSAIGRSIKEFKRATTEPEHTSDKIEQGEPDYHKLEK